MADLQPLVSVLAALKAQMKARKEESLPSYFEEERMLAEMAEACRLRGVAIDRREPGELGGYWGNR